MKALSAYGAITQSFHKFYCGLVDFLTYYSMLLKLVMLIYAD